MTRLHPQQWDERQQNRRKERLEPADPGRTPPEGRRTHRDDTGGDARTADAAAPLVCRGEEAPEEPGWQPRPR